MRRAGLLIAAISLLSACQTQVQPATTTLQNFSKPFIQQDRFLCAVEPREDDTATLKVLDLGNGQVRAVYVPGRILSLDADRSRGKLYLSVRSTGPRFDLYELDIATLALQRPASFSQAGMRPSDIKVRDQQVFASGTQNNRNTLLAYNLSQGGWSNFAFDFQPGRLEWGQQAQIVQAVHFDDENLIRSTIDLQQRRVTRVQTFPHGVPFGNNLGLVAPEGDYFYALHQLQGEVALFAFNLSTQSMQRDVIPEKAQGILYSSTISQDGRYMYATVDNRVERYELQGTQMRRLPPITLTAKEARYISLAQNQRTLYVSHDSKSSISRIHLQADHSYRIDEIPLPGQNNELAVF